MLGSITWLRRLALVAVLALFVAACGGDGGTDEPDDATEDGGDTEATEPVETEEEDTEAAGGGGGDGTLLLGYILPETGQLAFLGPPQIEAARFAIDQINAAGGVLGQEIPEMISGDEAGDEAVANQSADRLLAEGVDAIIGAAASGMSLAIIDKVTGAGVVQCSGSNTAPTFTDYEDEDPGFYIRTAPSDAMQGPVLAETIVGEGYTNVAILARADDYGTGLADATAAGLEEAGATVALNETYDPNATNFDAAVQQVVGANPDAVVLIAFEEGAQIIEGLIEQGLGTDTVGIFGADGLAGNIAGAVGDPTVLAGMMGTRPAPAEDPGFLDALQEFAPDLEETTFAGQVFDCVNIIALAAEVAGSDDPTVFQAELAEVTRGGEKCTSFEECLPLIQEGADIDYDGVTGPLEFIDAGEPGEASIEVYTFDEAGDVQPIDTIQTTLPEDA